MNNQITASLEKVQNDLETLMEVMKSVAEFRADIRIIGPQQLMISLAEAGKLTEAVMSGQQALLAAQNIFGAFLRNSVMDEKKLPRFIVRFTACREKGYDPDILTNLQTKGQELEKAVRTETNGSFARRAEAYNALTKAFDDADREQAERNRASKVNENARTLKARFTSCRERDYDPDILAGLEAMWRELEEVVRMKTNGTFLESLEAYNTAMKAFDDADREQARRKRVRQVIHDAKAGYRQKMIKRGHQKRGTDEIRGLL
jgi:hypothetical protein